MSQSQRKFNKHAKKKPFWPVLLLFFGAVLLVIGAVFAFRKPTAAKTPVIVTGSPSLQMDQEKVDLGYIKLGQTVEVKFKLTNVGDQNLEFTKTPYVEVVEGC